MAFRVERNGFVIHVDTAADVHALIADGETKAPKAPRRGKVAPRRSVKGQRGASSGSVSGRILEVLGEHGAMSPGTLAKAVKVDKSYVRKAVAELRDAGKVSVEGSTANRLIALAKK